MPAIHRDSAGRRPLLRIRPEEHEPRPPHGSAPLGGDGGRMEKAIALPLPFWYSTIAVGKTPHNAAVYRQQQARLRHL
jgi:hypothetical protein